MNEICTDSTSLIGVTGSYGRRLRAAVLGFGATARGAVTALNSHGVDEVHVLTNRDVAVGASPIHSTQILQMGADADTPDRVWADTPDGRVPVADNAPILQNLTKPATLMLRSTPPVMTAS